MPPPMRRLRSTRATPTPPTPPSPTTRRIELIVKLGGSCLTQKSTPHTLHPRRFTLAMDHIARLHSQNVALILVHGAGSFGHFEAHTHHVSLGTASPLGVSATHAAVTKLNQLVIDALIARGVPAVGVAPLLVPSKTRADFLAALLDRGHVPVVHGDACYAGDGRTAILSGDSLVASLAQQFEYVKRVVFLSDVPGVLSRPPEEVGGGNGVLAVDEDVEGVLVRRVTVNGEGEVCLNREVRTSCRGHDVSGGILAKVMAAAECVRVGRGRVVAFIAGVGTEGGERALGGKMPEPWSRLKCTRVVYEEG